ncbi:MAG: hypothetical protein AB8B69_13725 [Chitinophagales bacterium]
MYKILSFLFIAAIITSCDPYIEDDIDIGNLPTAPQFSMEPTAENPNLIVVKDLSGDFFSRVWEFEAGLPPSSTNAVDTVLFTKAGEYDITLHAAATGGSGTVQGRQTVTIAEDAVVECSDLLTLLTGGCGLEGKCWTFSTVAGAVTVGPEPGSGEWFTSTDAGLVPEQYDDGFCFLFEGASFQYENNGQTIDPFNGYVAVDYDPPTDYTWFINEGGGENGEDRIVLPEGAFMGVWDAGNLYDIVTLTEDELVVRTEFLDGGGWFELYFVAVN